MADTVNQWEELTETVRFEGHSRLGSINDIDNIAFTGSYYVLNTVIKHRVNNATVTDTYDTSLVDTPGLEVNAGEVITLTFNFVPIDGTSNYLVRFTIPSNGFFSFVPAQTKFTFKGSDLTSITKPLNQLASITGNVATIDFGKSPRFICSSLHSLNPFPHRSNREYWRHYGQ